VPDLSPRLDAARAFVIDPIDGTRAFIEGDHNWAHSLAVVDNGETVAAVVYLPMADKLYAAAKGHGATLNGARITVATIDALDVRSSLAYRMSLVAEGRFDAMLTLRPTWEWDVAAGALIVAEAGGRVTDRQGAQPRFNAAMPQIDGVVAAGPGLHGEITARLA